MSAQLAAGGSGGSRGAPSHGGGEQTRAADARSRCARRDASAGSGTKLRSGARTDSSLSLVATPAAPGAGQPGRCGAVPERLRGAGTGRRAAAVCGTAAFHSGLQTERKLSRKQLPSPRCVRPHCRHSGPQWHLRVSPCRAAPRRMSPRGTQVRAGMGIAHRGWNWGNTRCNPAGKIPGKG